MKDVLWQIFVKVMQLNGYIAGNFGKSMPQERWHGRKWLAFSEVFLVF